MVRVPTWCGPYMVRCGDRNAHACTVYVPAKSRAEPPHPMHPAPPLRPPMRRAALHLRHEADRHVGRAQPGRQHVGRELVLLRQVERQRPAPARV